MKRSAALCAISFLLLASTCDECEEVQRDCNDVQDPRTELTWVADYANDIDEDAELGKYRYIRKGIHNEQLVFILGDCCPFCNTIIVVKDCSGATIGTSGGSGVQPDQVSDVSTVHGGEECSFT